MLASIALGGMLLILATDTNAAAGVEPLFRAIREGNAAAMRQILDGGASANATDADGTPALMTAALFGDATCMKVLLDRGADPNATNGVGATALLWAVPDVAKVTLLIRRGANVNTASSNLGRTPLLVAASYPKSRDVMRVLLRNGANMGAKDTNGVHALGRAVRFADLASVRFLVQNGAAVNEPGFGEYGAEFAFGRHDVRLGEYLLSVGFKVPKPALALAGNWHRPKLLQRLVVGGADVNAPIEVLKSTPLVLATAAEQTSLDTLQWLLDKGANPNAESINGDRPLDWASYLNDQRRIELLKRYGAQPGRATRAVTYPAPDGVPNVRTALGRSAALLLSTGPVVFKNRACITCHNQTLPVQVGVIARQKGIPVDDAALNTNLRQMVGFYRPFAQQAMQGELPSDGPLQIGYVMMALAAAQHPLDTTTASLIHVVLSSQMPDGSWFVGGGSRPPMEDSEVSTTAMAVRALTLYPLSGRATQIHNALRRARQWLLATPATSAEERNMRLLGLVWTAAARRDVESAKQQVLQRQKPDGGWSQHDEWVADAYATGMSLVALHEAGTPARDDVYRRGVAYLLRQQYAKGAWLVRSRAYPVQPFFESGFPFGPHQWISAAGSSWAALALARTLPDRNN
jgi:ankyrin repeat protein